MKIENCPFCDSENVALTPSFMACDYVECRECWAHGPITGDSIKNKDKNKEKAIKMWNNRT